MTTAIDSNIVVALWNDEALNAVVQTALEKAVFAGPLVMAAPVYSELLAYPARNEAMLEKFCHEAGIQVDWQIHETIWRTAGRAFQGYVQRRMESNPALPRRIPADFLIGAHADVNRFSLLTLDQRVFRAAFPGLRILSV